jgi:hypothetical protein
MKMDQSKDIAQETERLGLKFLAGIQYDPQVEDAIGDVTKLGDTSIAQRIRKIAASTIK